MTPFLMGIVRIFSREQFATALANKSLMRVA